MRDLGVLRAFERVSRRDFVAPAYHEAADRDLPIPIDGGQTLQPAWLVARMIEALDVRSEHRVLEVGSGSGYSAAMLAQLAAEVLGLERFESLANAARQRLAALELANVAVVWGDATRWRGEDTGTFDRILVHGVVEAPVSFAPMIRPGGVLVCALMIEQGQAVVRLIEEAGAFAKTIVCPVRLQPIRGGLCEATSLDQLASFSLW